jgi:hypothetical protein
VTVTVSVAAGIVTAGKVMVRIAVVLHAVGAEQLDGHALAHEASRSPMAILDSIVRMRSRRSEVREMQCNIDCYY